MRNIKVAAAQLGPIQKDESRQAVVARMLDLMKQAKAQGCGLIVYPELALTTFFPRWYHEDRSEADIWFEQEMPNAATRPLFEEAAKSGMAMSFGYAELTPDGHHFNTSILVDKSGALVGKLTWRQLLARVELLVLSRVTPEVPGNECREVGRWPSSEYWASSWRAARASG